MKAAIIGVGTELTSGQILNKNASWISARLQALGIPTNTHIVVPDQCDLILDALRFCSQHGNTLFVTGGLGPTTDDFTREVISAWADLPLEFDESSWRQITERLNSRGVTVRESQRQQCYFPRGAKIFTNPDGTANAFSLAANGVKIYVLPGPPKEIAAIWNQHLQVELETLSHTIDRLITRSWDTMGLGESDIAHLTESCLGNSFLERGYRIHLPYVEVKVSHLESQAPQAQPLVEALNAALSFYTISRDGQDIAAVLANQLSSIPKIQFIDRVSGMALIERLTPIFKTYQQEKIWQLSTESLGHPPDLKTARLSLEPLGTHQAICRVQYKGANFSDTMTGPLFIMKSQDRRGSYFAECALIFWSKTLARIL